MAQGWLWLIAAGLAEIGFTASLKLSQGFSQLSYTLLFGLFAFLSFALLARATRQIALGTAYAVWTGIGAVGTALVGMLWFGEDASAGRLFFLVLIVTAIVGLRLSSKS
jgi:quaternary ammonium compound-resistance protein SugE